MAKRSRKQKKRRAKAYILRVVFVLGIITIAALVIFGAVKLFGSLLGDGRGTTEGNTLSISKKGSIEGTIIESFDKDYYSGDELQSMAEEEIAQYAAISGDDKLVTLSKYSEKDGKVELVLKYASANDYRSFNGKQLYAGTIEQVANAGVDFNLALNGTDDTTLAAGDILKNPKYHAVVLEEAQTVKVPKNILYTSANVTLIDSKTAQVTADDGALAYIIYK